MGQLVANNKKVVHEKEGNIVVINTCGFIDNAKQQSIDTILEYSDKKNQGKWQSEKNLRRIGLEQLPEYIQKNFSTLNTWID